MECDLNTSVPDWMIDHPETARVFDELGIDAGCAGKSLEWVCWEKGLSPQDVLERLRRVIGERREV